MGRGTSGDNVTGTQDDCQYGEEFHCTVFVLFSSERRTDESPRRDVLK